MINLIYRIKEDQKIPIILVCMMEGKTSISAEVAREFAKSKGIGYFESNLQYNINISQIFTQLCVDMDESMESQMQEMNITSRRRKSSIKMKITVKNINGEKISLNIDYNEPISSLKNKISEKWNLPVEKQTLYLNDKVLKNNKKISFYKIDNSSTICVFPKKIVIYYRHNQIKKKLLITEDLEKISNLKLMICELTEIPLQKIDLYFDDKCLEDEKMVSHYNITEKCELKVIECKDPKKSLNNQDKIKILLNKNKRKSCNSESIVLISEDQKKIEIKYANFNNWNAIFIQDSSKISFVALGKDHLILSTNESILAIGR